MSSVNGYDIVADSSADLTRLKVAAMGAGLSDPIVSIDASMRRVDASTWEVTGNVNGVIRTVRWVEPIPECEITCFVSSGLVAILTGVFCFIAVPLGAIGSAIICGAIAFTIGYGGDTVCERVVQSCDTDPNRNIFAVLIAQHTCATYWECETRGFVTSHLYQGYYTGFFAYEELYFSNNYEFGYQRYDDSDMNLRLTVDDLDKKVWQWHALLQPSVPDVYCTRSARLRVWAIFGTAGLAYSEMSVPKPFSDSCPN